MLKIKRGHNDLCSCDNREKYKKCCIGKDGTTNFLEKKGIKLKSQRDINGINRAGILVVKTLDLVESWIQPGITTNFINDIVHEYTIKNDAIPAPLNYRGYPKSVCISVNDVICHGIPNNRVLLDGDIVNVDVTSILGGYYADASKTFFVGYPKNDAKLIVNVAKKCLAIGIEMVKPGNTTNDIGSAIQDYAESKGCSVVREFVGHGIGIDFHEPPQILHYSHPGKEFPLYPNMIFTIEPMINLGKKELNVLDDGWTAVTSDGSWSAQFEQTICVTNDGYMSLTPYDF